MRRTILSVCLTVVLFSSAMVASGQAAKSPFSARGVGDIYSLGLTNNIGMGGVGISNGTYWHLNSMNPALLPYNQLTVFSAGLIGESRNVQNNTLSEKNGGGNLSYLATAFPIKPGIWTTAIGLSPYSNVDYQFSYDEPVIGDDSQARITEEGSGGLSQLYWSHGVSINKSLNVGLKATYLFSSYEKKFSTQLYDQDGGTPYTPVILERISVSDFMLSGGLAYKKDSIFGGKLRFNAGVTYDFKTDVKAKRFLTNERRISQQPVSIDTLENNIRGTTTLPGAFGGGISLSNGFKWTIGLDVKVQNWEDYRNFDGDAEAELGKSKRIALGAEFIPDISGLKYLQRVSYRVGLAYEETPYTIGAAQVKDFGINFGWSLPVRGASTLDMALTYGQRGNIDQIGIKEQYFKIYFGFNFNDRWFRQIKYD